MAVQRRKKITDLVEVREIVTPVKDPVRFHLNRHQQVVLLVSALLLLVIALVPPWKSTAADQFLGFYLIVGPDAQQALHSGSENVTVHTSLMALLIGSVVLGTTLLLGALALTREDWAALLTRMAQDSGVRHAAEIPGFLGTVRDTVADRVERLLGRVDFNMALVRSEDSAKPVRASSMEQHVLRRISDELARGSVAKAEGLLLRVRNHTVERYGEEHPFVDELDFRHANLLRDRGDLVRAEELYHRCIGRRERLYGQCDLRVATALQSYARLMLLMRRRVLAKRLEQLASAIREKDRRPAIDAIPVFGDGPVPSDHVLIFSDLTATSVNSIPKKDSPVSREIPERM
ncbi:MAG: tetratricopeptide repeat protein [bacterium]